MRDRLKSGPMEAQRLLVVGPAWIGDLVMADTLLKLLHAASPPPQIDLLAPAWALPLAARMAEVDEAIELPGGHGELALRARRRLGRSLRARGYARAYVLPRSAKAALVPWFARVPVRTGYLGESRYLLLNDIRRPAAEHHSVAQRYAALALAPAAELPDPLPVPALASTFAGRNAVLARLGLDPGIRAAALVPGAEYGPAKRWPAGHYAALAERLVAHGWQVWLLGSARERPLAEEIRAAAPAARNLAGETTLVEAVDVLAAAALAVTNDSGLMHVAAAVGTPLVAMYGSSSPRYTPPASPRARVIYHALPCSPCFARDCPLGHRNCLRGIGVDEVLATARRLAGDSG